MSEDRNHDLTHVYRMHFETQVNPTNLGLFIDSKFLTLIRFNLRISLLSIGVNRRWLYCLLIIGYIRRTDLDITRELDPLRKVDVRTIRAPILNVTGALSPHVDDTVTFNGRLDPVNSTWMKVYLHDVFETNLIISGYKMFCRFNF